MLTFIMWTVWNKIWIGLDWEGLLLPADGSIGLVVRRVVLLEHVGLLALDHSCVTLLG